MTEDGPVREERHRRTFPALIALVLIAVLLFLLVSRLNQRPAGDVKKDDELARESVTAALQFAYRERERRGTFEGITAELLRQFDPTRSYVPDAPSRGSREISFKVTGPDSAQGVSLSASGQCVAGRIVARPGQPFTPVFKSREADPCNASAFTAAEFQ